MRRFFSEWVDNVCDIPFPLSLNLPIEGCRPVLVPGKITFIVALILDVVPVHALLVEFNAVWKGPELNRLTGCLELGNALDKSSEDCQ